MIPNLIRRFAVANWVLASALVLALEGLDDNATAAVAVMTPFMVLAVIAGSLVASGHRGAALTIGTMLVLGSLVILGVGLLTFPMSVVTFGAVAVAISREAKRRAAV